MIGAARALSENGAARHRRPAVALTTLLAAGALAVLPAGVAHADGTLSATARAGG